MEVQAFTPWRGVSRRVCNLLNSIIRGFRSFQHSTNPPKATDVASPSSSPALHPQPSVSSWPVAGGGACDSRSLILPPAAPAALPPLLRGFVQLLKGPVEAAWAGEGSTAQSSPGTPRGSHRAGFWEGPWSAFRDQSQAGAPEQSQLPVHAGLRNSAYEAL